MTEAVTSTKRGKGVDDIASFTHLTLPYLYTIHNHHHSDDS